MAFPPQILEQLVQLGANVEIGSEARYLPETLESIVRIARARGCHVTICAEGCLPTTLERIAQLGGSHVTFRL